MPEGLMKITSFEQFSDLARAGTFVPVCKEIMADLLTPVSAFLRVAGHSDFAFLLESVEGGEQVARYSFLGKDPLLVLRSERGRAVIDRAGVTVERDEPFLDVLRGLMTEYRAPRVPGLPRFAGGAVGYLGYDAAAWFEPAVAVKPRPEDDGRDVPAAFMLFDSVLAFDHARHRILIIANAHVTPGADLQALYRFACARIGFLERELAAEASAPTLPAPEPVRFESNTTREQFIGMVEDAKGHIAAGDVYQVVLSQRFEATLQVDPFRVYRALRHVNPSPYMFFLRVGGTAIAGASPEMLVRVEGTRVETRPIAGTRPRGADADEDLRLAEELKANEKERAEHVMLVDLGRNDIGRVSEYRSVRVPALMAVEHYSHVMHLVSVVEGRLASGVGPLDALAACFPAGTVSGAPKVRAMQLIAELERAPRGLYAGAVGYIDCSGQLDFCIAIRTIVIEGGRAAVQAGAGIVADSDPAAEYEESRAKAEALLAAVQMAARTDW
jgi:anthranilate synthase component 1